MKVIFSIGTLNCFSNLWMRVCIVFFPVRDIIKQFRILNILSMKSDDLQGANIANDIFPYHAFKNPFIFYRCPFR